MKQNQEKCERLLKRYASCMRRAVSIFSAKRTLFEVFCVSKNPMYYSSD